MICEGASGFRGALVDFSEGRFTQAYTLSCPGMVTTNADGSPACTNGSGAVVAWVSVPPFDVSQLDYGEAGQAFAAGFVIIGMCAILGRVVGAIVSVVKR